MHIVLQPVMSHRSLQVTFRVFEDRRHVMICHKSAQGSLKVQNGGRRAIEVLAVPPPQPTGAAGIALETSDASASHSRQASQSSSVPHAHSMLAHSQPTSSRPSSRDLSPTGQPRTLSISQRTTMSTVGGDRTLLSVVGAERSLPGTIPGAASAATDQANNFTGSGAAESGTRGAAPGAGATPSSAEANGAALSSSHANALITPSSMPASKAGSGKRVRGSVVRIIKKNKRLPNGIWLGLARTTSNESWTRGKGAAVGDSNDPFTISNLLKQKGLNTPAIAADVLFWSTDIPENEHREALQRNDEIEYAVTQRPIEEGDSQLIGTAKKVALVRAHRPAPAASCPGHSAPLSGAGNSSGKWQPSSMPGAASARKAPKFQGASAINVPGPDKGAVGFTMGRGKTVPEPKKGSLGGFSFDKVLNASAFVPKRSGNLDSVSADAGTSGSDPVARLPLAPVPGMELYVGQFDDH